MKTRIQLFIVALLACITAGGQTWVADTLCAGYEMRHVRQADDYSGEVISTIIRKMVPDSVTTHRGVLYVHGFNDYFLQSELGEQCVAHGYDFYAVDLRKYGRSLLPGQKRYQVREISEYFPDIDSAVVDMSRQGIDEIVLMGHSTGGLVTSCYMNASPSGSIKALVLNSPFLDWNLGNMEHIVGLVSAWGKLFPGTRIPQGKSTAYAESLLKKYHGEWNYDTQLKLEQSPDVDAGWVRAIHLAQKSLRDGKSHIDVPILLMYSGHSVDGDAWTDAFNHGDAVLDVADIKKYGKELGPNVTFVRVEGGLHDLFLSARGVRMPLYRYVFNWLSRWVVPCGKHAA